ncbi:MAG: polymer-forming cytoskeletal protein [Phycisphaerae bacterium]|nr:polymer-forming cytoskeletal protein [Phycisphaerae bacterium]
MSDEGQITIIGKDAKIKGELSFENSAKILGGFEGKISAKGEVIIGETANCRATVEAGTVIVDGPIEGDIIAKDRIQLTPKAKVKGDIIAASLTVGEGASFVGHCKVGPDAVKLSEEPNAELELKSARAARNATTAHLANGAANGTANANNGASWLAGTRAE